MLAKEFKTLVLPLSSKLHRFALQFTKNEEEAQDESTPENMPDAAMPS